MELRVLKYFLTAAREENITKAARILHVTQPTLSRQIMQLEEELGVKLFVRSNHNITLTADGMLLRQRAEEIVSLAEGLEKGFSRGKRDLAGEIAIGSGELLSFDFLVRIMKAFRQEHPLVRYYIYSGAADLVQERMEGGLVDLGLLMEPVDIDKYEFTRMPGKETWGVLVRSDSRLAGKAEAGVSDVAGLPLLMSKRAVVQKGLSSWFGMSLEHLDIVATFNLINNAAIMVRENMGAALCVDRCHLFDDLRFIPLSPRLESRSVLAWKKSHMLPPASAAFLAFAQKCISDISSDVI
jgi:DNA-binding transcriptional LysR family regulator